MQEIEVQFKFNSPDEIEPIIKDLGFSFVETKFFEDQYFTKSGNFSNQEDLIRLRQENDNITLTYKSPAVKEDGILKREEINVNPDNFEKTALIFEEIGLKEVSKKETQKTYYKKGALTLEVIKVIKPSPFDYAEIEGDEEEIKALLVKLEGKIKIISEEEFPKII
jgi:predicted adenylyl cyclase CyaB